jgi:hypothetical protein
MGQIDEPEALENYRDKYSPGGPAWGLVAFRGLLEPLRHYPLFLYMNEN